MHLCGTHSSVRMRETDFVMSSMPTRRRQWHPNPELLPGKSHGWRSLVGCSPWGHEELDMTEQLHFHFSLSCTGEGNGNPLQCSCLENPRDGRAWWAAVCGVAQSRTRLKQLSSSSSNAHQGCVWQAGVIAIHGAQVRLFTQGPTETLRDFSLHLLTNDSSCHPSA